MQPDSLAGIGNPLGKTFAETCQVLIFRLSPEPTQRYSLAGISNPLGKTFAETCQVLLFFPSQIPAADWFTFNRYHRLHAYMKI